MLTLSYGVLLGLLLAAFVLGIFVPFLLVIYLVFTDRLR